MIFVEMHMNLLKLEMIICLHIRDSELIVYCSVHLVYHFDV